MLMEDVGVDLASFLKVDGTDGVEETGRVISGRITNLATVARVVEEVASTGFGDEPVYCRL
jgi:hypothetical protein